MIRVAFKTKITAPSTSLTRLENAFKDTDDLFSMSDNEREMEVLCSAGLVLLCRAGEGVSPAAALAVTTAAAAGARKPGVSLDIVAAAEAGLRVMAESVRKRPDLQEYAKADAPELDFEQVVAKIRGQSNWDGVMAAFGLAEEAVRESVARVARQSARAAAAVKKFIAVQDEELQMLWWLIGERSWYLDTAFTAVPADAQPLVLSKELADLTEFLPGPPSVKGLLGRAGLQNRKKLTIPSAVNACDKAWLGKVVHGLDPSPVTHPVHFAIKRKLETGDDVSWVPGWAAVSALNSAHQLSPLILGNHFYRECLLAHFKEE